MTTPSTDTALSVENLEKSYGRGGEGEVRAVDGVSFEIKPGEFYTLLGPSGCGKTTTLRSVAGLERPDGGRVTIDGRTVSENGASSWVPPNLRGLGMVFQSYAIWPHMTVFENTAFSLKVDKPRVSKAEVRRRVDEALEAVELGGYQERNATALSGGQQQRLALARALVRRPKLLLLDEPLSNLDAKLRDSMRDQVKDLQRRLNISTLYVTHDQAEALSMSTKIAVMSKGRIIQEGKPRDIYQKPLTRFVANFVGQTNFIGGRVRDMLDSQHIVVETSVGMLEIDTTEEFEMGRQVTVSIRPENIDVQDLSEARASDGNTVAARVTSASFLGESLHLKLDASGTEILVRVHGDGGGVRRIVPGDDVALVLPKAGCVILRDVADGEVSPARGVAPSASV
jgi:iron(III) transport system ATP-binding protein